MEHKFYTEQFLPIPIEQAWTFFSSPQNLSLITPPEMEFRILTQLNREAIYEGMTIEYIVRPIGRIPMKWKTEIGKTIPYSHFTDKQIQGPYAKWEHHHSFAAKDAGTLMTDNVIYRLPLGPLGDLVHKWFVQKRIQDIFNYRKRALNQLFPLT